MSDRFLHLAHVDQATASAGLCGETHLPSGRVCLLRARHSGGCAFVSREAALLVAQRRAAHWGNGRSVGGRPV